MNLDVIHHRSDVSRANLNELADRLRVPRSDIDTILRDWRESDVRDHLSTFTAPELKPPAFRGP